MRIHCQPLLIESVLKERLDEQEQNNCLIPALLDYVKRHYVSNEMQNG